jgi:hypothetical protein
MNSDMNRCWMDPNTLLKKEISESDHPVHVKTKIVFGEKVLLKGPYDCPPTNSGGFIWISRTNKSKSEALLITICTPALRLSNVKVHVATDPSEFDMDPNTGRECFKLRELNQMLFEHEFRDQTSMEYGHYNLFAIEEHFFEPPPVVDPEIPNISIPSVTPIINLPKDTTNLETEKKIEIKTETKDKLDEHPRLITPCMSDYSKIPLVGLGFKLEGTKTESKVYDVASLFEDDEAEYMTLEEKSQIHYHAEEKARKESEDRWRNGRTKALEKCRQRAEMKAIEKYAKPHKPVEFANIK